jgi:tetratricopeptide (TPR) repeat protein
VVAPADARLEPRYRMLDTIHQFAGEELAGSGEADVVRSRHLRYFLTLAETAEPELRGPHQQEWFDRIEADHDNFRQALAWSQGGAEGPEAGLRLAAALARFWEVRGYMSEGRERLTALLAAPGAPQGTLTRSRALAAAAQLAYRQSDYAATRSLFEASLSISRALDDPKGVAVALVGLGNAATEVGDYETAPALFQEALTIRRSLHDARGTANALLNLGWCAMRPGDWAQARIYLEEALGLYRAEQDTSGTAMALSGLGEAALRSGDTDRALALLKESLGLRRELGDKWGSAVSLGSLGWAALEQGSLGQAANYLRESLALRRELSDRGGIAWCLERLAAVALKERQFERAVRLFGAAASLRASMGSVIDPADRPGYEQALAALHAGIDPQKFAAGWTEGSTLGLEQAVEMALRDPDPDRPLSG